MADLRQEMMDAKVISMFANGAFMQARKAHRKGKMTLEEYKKVWKEAVEASDKYEAARQAFYNAK